MAEPTLKNYIARYKMDRELLKKHPEHGKMLVKRIAEHERAILDYVTSDNFASKLELLNL